VPVAGDLAAAAVSLAAGRDLLGTHFARGLLTCGVLRWRCVLAD
jgi:hypothetical protein